ncbi:MAG: hypothetical protein KTR29_00940 [Rhodothermaceae bacterium]|nr:hypothetical protein [Rhodothermaceae bacterium]
MIYLCIYEDDAMDRLTPIIETRSVFQLRLGARTIHRRIWDKLGRPSRAFHVRPHLADHISSQYNVPVNTLPEGVSIMFINGRLVSAPAAFYAMLLEVMRTEKESRVFMQGDEMIAAWVPNAPADLLNRESITREVIGTAKEEVLDRTVVLLHHLWNLLDYLHDALLDDVQDLIRFIPSLDRSNSQIDHHSTVINPSDIYLARNAQVAPGAILNAAEGPIYIDSGARIMEAALVKGPVYIGPQSVVKAQTNIEQSAIGPVCKVAGEIHSAIFQSYSNKAHAGFVGNSYIGSWCNLGADTNTSNLRNDYAPVTLYSEKLGIYQPTGRQFLGLIMGDHSKCGINTMFNTGTLTGVFCNLYGSGFQSRYVPSFSWGGPESGLEPYRIDKAIAVAERVMARRNIELAQSEQQLLHRIFSERHEKLIAQ